MSAASRVRGVVVDVAAVAVTFAVLGVAGAFLWHHQVDLPAYTRTAQGAVLDQLQLAKMVNIDGWYAAIAVAGGLVAGILLTWMRGREPLVLVVLLVAGGALAAWLMLHLGAHLGPHVTRATLDRLPQGGRALVPLQPHARGVEYVWPMAALVGAIAVLLGGHDPAPKPREHTDEAASSG